MAVEPRVLRFDVTLDATGAAHSALGGSPIAREEEWWAEHLVLAGLLRCTLTSLDYSAGRAGVQARGTGSARGIVTKRDEDGLYAFVDLETRFEIELEPALGREATRQLLDRAERGCFVSNSLTTPTRRSWIVNGQEIA